MKHSDCGEPAPEAKRVRPANFLPIVPFYGGEGRSREQVSPHIKEQYPSPYDPRARVCFASLFVHFTFSFQFVPKLGRLYSHHSLKPKNKPHYHGIPGIEEPQKGRREGYSYYASDCLGCGRYGNARAAAWPSARPTWHQRRPIL